MVLFIADCTSTCGSFKDRCIQPEEHIKKKCNDCETRICTKKDISPKDRRRVLEEVVLMQAWSSTRKAEQKGSRKAPPLKGEVGGERAEPFPVCRVQVRENICLLPWDKWLSTVDTALSHGDGDRSVVQADVRSSTLSQCRFHASAALTSVLSLLFTRIHSSKGSRDLLWGTCWHECRSARVSVAQPQTRSITA